MRLVDRREPCQVMGVLNVTPDSFSDGGRFVSVTDAVVQSGRMIAAGADIIDVGGESTRPGAEPVSVEQELSRVLPIVESLHREFDVPISIDTGKPAVMREAVAAGASMINDVQALRADGALQAAAELGVPVCLMHMRGEPRSMQRAPSYEDVVGEVCEFLRDRAQVSIEAGIAAENIVLDPGFGFGKTLEHNLELLRRLDRVAELGFPVLVGLSRKSMLGQLLDRGVEDRLPGSLALAMLARQAGASIIRVHDVAPTVDVLRVLEAIEEEPGSNG